MTRKNNFFLYKSRKCVTSRKQKVTLLSCSNIPKAIQTPGQKNCEHVFQNLENAVKKDEFKRLKNSKNVEFLWDLF